MCWFLEREWDEVIIFFFASTTFFLSPFSYLVIRFRSIPFWICVGGERKKWETHVLKWQETLYFTRASACATYLFLLLNFLTSALHRWVDPDLLHLSWLWHSDICDEKDMQNLLMSVRLCGKNLSRQGGDCEAQGGWWSSWWHQGKEDFHNTGVLGHRTYTLYAESSATRVQPTAIHFFQAQSAKLVGWPRCLPLLNISKSLFSVGEESQPRRYVSCCVSCCVSWWDCPGSADITGPPGGTREKKKKRLHLAAKRTKEATWQTGV